MSRSVICVVGLSLLPALTVLQATAGWVRAQSPLRGSQILQHLEEQVADDTADRVPDRSPRAEAMAAGDGRSPAATSTQSSHTTLDKSSVESSVETPAADLSTELSDGLPLLLVVLAAAAGAIWFWERYGRRRRHSVDFPFAYQREDDAHDAEPRSRRKRSRSSWLNILPRSRRNRSVDYPFMDVEVVEKRRRP